MAFFENIETLSTPYDIFMFDTNLATLPHRAHWHYYVEILYMYQGYMTVECDNAPHILHPGDLIVIMPKVVHSIYSDYDGHIQYGVVKFNPNDLHFSNQNLPLIHGIFSDTPPADLPVHLLAKKLAPYPVKALINQLIHELAHKELCYTDLIDSVLCLLIISVLRVWQISYGIDLEARLNQNVSPSQIHSILEYISDHSCEQIVIPELAQRCNMSYSTFSRLFKQQTGRSCKEYIEYVRICKAQDLLFFTDHSLSYIAAETGFTDCSHFIRVYKKLLGITPAQQRKSSCYKTGS